MKKIRIGVLGAYRGTSMINYCIRAENAEVVAICDKATELLEQHRKSAEGLNITFYDNFDDFILHDMDAVVLANYANEHAPFAIRALKAGKHVFSEVLPVQTMKEAVELIEAVEETGLVYAYGENYCYMPAPYEMRKLTVKERSVNLNTARVNISIIANPSGTTSLTVKPIIGATICIPPSIAHIHSVRSFTSRVCAPFPLSALKANETKESSVSAQRQVFSEWKW